MLVPGTFIGDRLGTCPHRGSNPKGMPDVFHPMTNPKYVSNRIPRRQLQIQFENQHLDLCSDIESTKNGDFMNSRTSVTQVTYALVS